MSRCRIALALLAAGLAGPAAAQAAPPPNDAPAGAAPFTTVTAENGPVAEQQGLAELAEATPDAGVPRCLGAASFARTVWFRIPGATVPRLLRVEATGPSGASADVPDLAAYVQAPDGGAPNTTEAQACDGAAAGGAATSADGAAAVELRVPAGRAVLVQAGRSAGEAERIVLSLAAQDLPAVPAAAGDEAGDARRITRDRAVSVPLQGATLTREDPAQPRCAASGSIWRRVVATRSGRHVLRATGAAVGAMTAFVGSRPTADNAVACANRTAVRAPLVLVVTAKRRDVIWVRLGTDAVAAGMTTRLTVASPVTRPRLLLGLLGGRRAAALRVPRARVLVGGAAVRQVRVRLQRKVGRRWVTVATGRVARTIRAGGRATVALRRTGRLRAGSYRLVAGARPATGRGAAVRATGRTVRLR